MTDKKTVYLLRKAAKHLQADDQQELAQSVKDAADHFDAEINADKESIAVRHRNLAMRGRAGNHLVGVVGSLKSVT